MFGELLTPTHMIFILIIVLVIFGPSRLPEIGRGIGKGIKEFKGTMDGITGESESETKTKSTGDKTNV